MERSRLGETRLNVGKNERMISTGLGALLVIAGLRRSWGSMLVTLFGGYLVYRGLSGNCRMYGMLNVNTSGRTAGGEPVRALPDSIKIQRSVTINRSPAEVYLFWRNLENLPRFMQYLQSVTVTGSKTSHWVAKAPIGGLPLEWDAEILDERENELIAWGSLPGSTLVNTGRVRFQPAPGNRGTEVHVTLEYAPPGGTAGVMVARLLNKISAQSVKEDLRRFKEVMEAGEVPTTDGQPSGRQAAKQEQETGRAEPATAQRGSSQEAAQGQSEPRRLDVVGEASADSFPASDPPAYIKGLE